MKQFKLVLKRFFLVLGLILTSPLIVLAQLEGLLLGKTTEYIYSSCKELLSLMPTVLGEYMRLAFYWAVCSDVSIDAHFMFGCMVAHRDTIIRRGAVIGVHTILGYCEIQENVLFAARVSLISGKYQHGRPEERAGGIATLTQMFERIVVGRNSWIGQEAIIMARIGENCTVAAGSVVYKAVPDGTTVMGNPARKVSIDISAPVAERPTEQTPL